VKIHGFWTTINRTNYPRIRDPFIKALGNVQPMGIPPHVGHILFQILDDEKRSLATSWLSGIHLSEADLQSLGIPAPLGDEEVSEVINPTTWLKSLRRPHACISFYARGRPEDFGPVSTRLVR
jgi:hypothetical protein